jgi:hypothetical protein
MKFTRGHMLMAVAALALIAVWYISKQKVVSEAFVVPKDGRLMESFNSMQKEMACKVLEEQLTMYSDMLKNPATTDEDKKMQEGIAKTVDGLKSEQVKQGCKA